MQGQVRRDGQDLHATFSSRLLAHFCLGVSDAGPGDRGRQGSSFAAPEIAILAEPHQAQGQVGGEGQDLHATLSSRLRAKLLHSCIR